MTGDPIRPAPASESTVHRHVRIDPGFANVYREAPADGYVRLEAELLRQRLAAQEKLRAAMDDILDAPSRNGEGDHSPKADGGGTAAAAPWLKPCPTCGRSAEADIEFDRIMKLFARWDRKPRKVETRFTHGGDRQPWTFDQAIDAKLRAWGAPRRAAGEEEGK
jgi:hypothetical protein